MPANVGKGVKAVRQLFPEVCKWYMPEGESAGGKKQVEAEVLARSKRFQEKGISPCHECPLCPGDHGH